MKIQYEEYAAIFKVLSDYNRLMIVDMLSCGELCACNILEKFHITQSTLSHHMKVLCDCGLVKSRKEGRWMHYSLKIEKFDQIKQFMNLITTNHNDCICKENNQLKNLC